MSPIHNSKIRKRVFTSSPPHVVLCVITLFWFVIRGIKKSRGGATPGSPRGPGSPCGPLGPVAPVAPCPPYALLRHSTKLKKQWSSLILLTVMLTAGEFVTDSVSVGILIP